MIPTNIAMRYKAVQVKTCSPGHILVLLYEGALRFLGEAAAAMRAGDRARAGERIGRAHAILGELCVTMKRDEAPELCADLLRLYRFCMGYIVEANLHQDPARLDAVARVLMPLSDAFTQVVRSTEAAAAHGAPSIAMGA